jgi:disulfide bond formation protein DsbB
MRWSSRLSMTIPRSLRAERLAQSLGALSLALILGALAFQYLGHIAPCEMCHWQRWPHIAAALIGLVGGTLVAGGGRNASSALPLALAAIVILLVAVSGLIGAYQTGMQWHLLPGPSACTGRRFVLGSDMVPEVQCDVVTWQLFGLSLAAYNALISLAAATFGAALLWRRR